MSTASSTPCPTEIKTQPGFGLTKGNELAWQRAYSGRARLFGDAMQALHRKFGKLALRDYPDGRVPLSKLTELIEASGCEARAVKRRHAAFLASEQVCDDGERLWLRDWAWRYGDLADGLERRDTRRAKEAERSRRRRAEAATVVSKAAPTPPSEALEGDDRSVFKHSPQGSSPVAEINKKETKHPPAPPLDGAPQEASSTKTLTSFAEILAGFTGGSELAAQLERMRTAAGQMPKLPQRRLCPSPRALQRASAPGVPSAGKKLAERGVGYAAWTRLTQRQFETMVRPEFPAANYMAFASLGPSTQLLLDAMSTVRGSKRGIMNRAGALYHAVRELQSGGFTMRVA